MRHFVGMVRGVFVIGTDVRCSYRSAGIALGVLFDLFINIK